MQRASELVNTYEMILGVCQASLSQSRLDIESLNEEQELLNITKKPRQPVYFAYLLKVYANLSKRKRLDDLCINGLRALRRRR